MSYICSYCGKEIGNHGCLILHEKYCKNNPNRIISKTQSIREERDSRRDINGILRKKGHELSEETKQKISKSRKEWLIKNKDKHIWNILSILTTFLALTLDKLIFFKNVHPLNISAILLTF